MMKIQKISAFQPNFNKQEKDTKSNCINKKYCVIAGGAVVAVTIGCLSYVLCHKSSNNFKTKFIELCKSLKNENYVVSPQNIENGIFAADLHSHSNHSDGSATVNDLLEQVTQYANEFNKKTGKKFTFSLTDHDTVSGVAEVQSIIKKSPDKYKNINFIPGVELSFIFNSNNEVKNGELLAYFIEPESNEMQILVKNLQLNRQNMIDNFIKAMGNGFEKKELNNFFLNQNGELFAYNLHYRLSNYAQIKNRINNIALEQNKDPQKLYKELMNGYIFENPSYRVSKSNVSPKGFDEFLKRKNILTKTPVLSDEINQKCQQFFPKIVDGKVVSESENSFEKIIDTLKYNKNVVLAFAHPYFTAQNMVDYKSEFKNMLNYANGKIMMTESYHQSYPNNISRKIIEEINQFLTNQKLIAIGGRDNHKSNFV